ncbi:hypothetical protein N665_2287s0002 [Sinapis alba]|nr:hypothetical protein N665_2287s0002 [Sinapis alba]
MEESMKEILEAQSCIRESPWLIQMVKSKLFHEVCDQHIKEQRRYFCCDCMIPPFCNVCFKKNDHKDHLTIQAFRCSNQTAVRKDFISKYMDISGIHIFSVNGSWIVFINQRCENGVHRFRNNVSHRCKVCGWAFETSSSAFCSLECKFRNALGSQFNEMMESLDDAVNKEESLEDVFEPIVKRKHRRKGTPYRSPFY